MIELERTFLLKKIPEGLKQCNFKEVIDVYIPKKSVHPTLRIRKNGDSYKITKKEPIDGTDSSHQAEHTTPLSKEEFEELTKLDGKKVGKLRYKYSYKGRVAEIDVFLEELRGLVLVDFEFETVIEKDSFEMPDFCLIEVTQEEFLAGGMLCGKKYSDIEDELKKFGYSKILVD